MRRRGLRAHDRCNESGGRARRVAPTRFARPAPAILLLLTAAPAGCAGGPPPELGPGSRVRVRVDAVPAAWIAEGFLRAVTDDSLVLDPVGPRTTLSLPRASLRSLEVFGSSPGKDQAIETAAEIGFAAGALAARAARRDDDEDDDEDRGRSLGELAAGLLGGLLVGGVTSLVTGGGGEVWHAIPVSRLDALTRGRHDGPVTISLPDASGGASRPAVEPDSVLDLDSG